MLIYNKLTPISEVKSMIALGRVMILAGEEQALLQIPKGNWIAGTIPYFMNETGGCLDKKQIFVTDLTNIITDFKIAHYHPSSLSHLLQHRFSNGFTWLLIPGMSPTHYQFALEVGTWPNLLDVPIAGWITGTDLSEFASKKPQVIDGTTGCTFDNSAVAIHCRIEDDKYANLQIINLFEQGEGDTITFNEDGFSARHCFINGHEANFTDYLLEKKIDTRLPLVANYSGAMINISLQQIDNETGVVSFYAPVLKNIEYKFAKPIGNYVEEFNKRIPSNASNAIASCNCILNYLYSKLKDKNTGDINGPFTFGEIAYMLVNQTMVLLSIENR
jgi:hypothetical protein